MMNEIPSVTVQRPDSPDNMDIDPSPAQQRSRKHLRSSDDDEDIEWSSDVSGRFDDADEPDLDGYKSPSFKSVKRRRSNDWPLPDEAADYGNNGSRSARHGNGNGSLGPNYKASPRASPRASAASLRNRHKVTAENRLARRSRFVEATMSDSVSEKPPSELFRDQKAAAGHRGSGIFRFGKAIAAAFNPFGGWGKNSAEANKSPQKDALTSAEEAYAELKRAGYKGTNKGAYMQNQHIDSANADQTWQAIQEKMGHRNSIPSAPSQAEPSSPLRSPLSPFRSPSKSSKRTSFQDLRKATSFGIPFIKHTEQQPIIESSACLDHPSEDSENNGIRRQKSRKELSRENKLIKKVSNLEDKLDRARRELRQLSGNEERLPATTVEPRAPSFDMDPGSYPRKFVPGALPTLPSERLLDQQAMESALSENGAAQISALPSVEGRSISPEETQSITKSAKRFSKESRPSSMGKESSSRKRKPSVPEPIASRQPIQSSPTDCIDNDRLSEYKYLIDAGFISPTRQSKWPKFESGESPGSVERKRQLNQQASMAALDGGSMHRRSQSLQPRSSSLDNRSPKSKNIISPPPLRTPLAHYTARPSTSPSHSTMTPTFKSDPVAFDFSSPPPPLSDAHRSFYLQPSRQLDPDRLSRTSPIKSPPGHRRRHSYDVDIPPVPPLPKEFRMHAAKVTNPSNNSRNPRNPARDSAPAILPQQTLSALKNMDSKSKRFNWPEDIF